MQNVIAPTFSFPLGAAPGGSIVEPGIEIAGTPASVFVAEAVWNESWWQWFWWHLPTFALAAFVISAVLLFPRIRKVVRAKQVVGSWYCRKCNHLMSEPHIRVEEKKAVWSSAESRCPECGDRSEHGPEAGKMLAVRIRNYALPLWLLGSLLLIQVLSNLGWQKQAWRGPSGTWPVDGLEPVFGPWAIQRQKSLDEVQGWRYWKVDPIGHEIVHLGTVASSRATQFNFVSPDGKFIVTPSASANTLLLIDTQSRAQRSVQLGPWISMGLSRLHVLGYSDGGETAFVERTTLYGPADELFGIDLVSGASKVIASASSGGGGIGLGSHSYKTFVVGMGPEMPVWVHTESISHYPQAGSQKYVRWTRNGRSFEKFIDTDGDKSIVNVLPHADAVSIKDTNDITKFYSLETGEEIERPKQADASSRSRLPVRVLTDWRTGTSKVEDANRTPLGTMQFSNAARAYPKRSDDGRLFAAMDARKVDGPLAAWFRGVPQVNAPEVRIWDLLTLLPPSGAASGASNDPASEKASPGGVEQSK